jgi:hypothetical protein
MYSRTIRNDEYSLWSDLSFTRTCHNLPDDTISAFADNIENFIVWAWIEATQALLNRVTVAHGDDEMT